MSRVLQKREARDINSQQPVTIESYNMFALENLSSIAVTRCVPWEFKKNPPEHVRKDKKARSQWINYPGTKWQVYSLVEGWNDNQRIKHLSNSTPESDSNPPYRLHGFVGDYDSPMKDNWRESISSFPFVPQYVEKTLSGNARCIWLFEMPLLVPSSKFLRFFLQNVLVDFRADRLLAGFDEKAWLESNRYFTNSGDWFAIEGAQPIPADRVRGWMVQISNKFSWDKEANGVEVPFDVLRTELADKYPRFAEWPGDFELGTQGPSFWIDGSTSPKSAIVRETGMQTFSAHAHQSFYRWADLIGFETVKKYNTENIGRAVEDIFHDGKYYWRKLPTGAWRSFSKPDLMQHLRVDRFVSAKRDEANISNIDRCTMYVQNHQSVVGAGPFVLRPDGVLEINGERILNICTRRVLRPAEKDTPWGPNGRMPFLSEFIGFSAEDQWAPGFLNSREATEHLLAWGHRYYKGGYEQAPVSGHMLFIAGPTGVGKTFFNALLGKIMGGYIDAESYLLDRDNFNSDLFNYAHWAIDDAVMTTTLTAMRTYSERIKKLVANHSFRSNEKFRVATVVTWLGRLVATTNVDERSIRSIPDLAGSILDKIMLFRTADATPVVFPEQSELAGILKSEAPYFARKLLNYKIPESLQAEARFGVQPYHDPSLLIAAEHSSSTGGFLSLLNCWKKSYFEHNPNSAFWEGPTYELHRELAVEDHQVGMLRRHDTGWIDGQLATLKGKGHRIDCVNATSRIWKIYRDSEDAPPPPPETIPRSESPNKPNRFCKKETTL
jgi:hypothetical protein